MSARSSILAALALAVSAPAAGQCTIDCSGHEAGYAWAEENGIEDESECGGNSMSFIEGCEDYARDQREGTYTVYTPPQRAMPPAPPGFVIQQPFPAQPVTEVDMLAGAIARYSGAGLDARTALARSFLREQPVTTVYACAANGGSIFTNVPQADCVVVWTNVPAQ